MKLKLGVCHENSKKNKEEYRMKITLIHEFMWFDYCDLYSQTKKILVFLRQKVQCTLQETNKLYV